MRYKKREDNNRTSGFMVDLAIGYYNENQLLYTSKLLNRFVKVDFSDCGPYVAMSFVMKQYQLSWFHK